MEAVPKRYVQVRWALSARPAPREGSAEGFGECRVRSGRLCRYQAQLRLSQSGEFDG